MPFEVRFDPDSRTLVSSVQGVLSAEEVEAWSTGLRGSTAGLQGTAEFRFLSNLFDYEVADQDIGVHMQMREIGPRFLAAHGFAVGFWRLYEETPPAPSRAGICTRVAHLHRDCSKMERYNEVLASPVERFFCDPGAAHAWLGAGGR